MKIKRLASLLVAGLMALSMAVPAFASDPFSGGGTDTGTGTGTGTSTSLVQSKSLNFTGSVQVPTISVDLTQQASIILNPYGLVVDSTTNNADQFVSDTVYLTSNSDCAIAISGTLTPTVAGNATLVDTAAKALAGTAAKPSAANNVFVMAVVGEVASADKVIEFDASSTEIAAVISAAAAENPSRAASAVKYWEKMKVATKLTNYKGLKTNDPADKKSGLYILKQSGTAVGFGDGTDANTNKLPYVLAAPTGTDPTVLAFRLFGACEPWVTTSWTSADTVSVALAFTITPQVN